MVEKVLLLDSGQLIIAVKKSLTTTHGVPESRINQWKHERTAAVIEVRKLIFCLSYNLYQYATIFCPHAFATSFEFKCNVSFGHLLS